MVLKYIVYFHIIFNRNSLLNCYIKISLCYTSFWRTPILVRVHSRVGGGRNFKILEMEDFWTFLVMHTLPPSLLSLKPTTHTHTHKHTRARAHTHTPHNSATSLRGGSRISCKCRFLYVLIFNFYCDFRVIYIRETK